VGDAATGVAVASGEVPGVAAALGDPSAAVVDADAEAENVAAENTATSATQMALTTELMARLPSNLTPGQVTPGLGKSGGVKPDIVLDLPVRRL
jgi:hypothetical protein